MTKENRSRATVVKSPESGTLPQEAIDPAGNPAALLPRLAPWLLIGGAVLFHAINNWIWLAANVTWTGWDKARHLTQSLAYAEIFRSLSLQSLFEATVSDPIRPPLFGASASILYALFGRSDDVAVMVHILYMVVALAATYSIGNRWGGRRVGLVAVALVSLFPMFYAMSRYFYIEFALMAMVVLAVSLALATDGFRRKGLSLLFGLSLGLGMLTKRTFGVFVAGPLVVAVLSAGLLPMLWARLKQRPTVHWKQLLLSLVGGFALSALWYGPNREMVQTLRLGDALFVIWWALAALTIYFATLPAAPLANALAAAFLGTSVASLWYLTRVEFVERVALYGYGIGDPRGRQLQLDNPDTYLYYVRKLVNEHLSLVLTILAVGILLLALAAYVRRQGSLAGAVRRVRPEGWMVLGWLGVAYGLLTLSIYQETRAFTPALPAVALIVAAAWAKLPWRWLRGTLLVVLPTVGLVQFFALTYEPVQRALPAQTLDLPGLGQTSGWAQGVYIQLPDEGQTDSGYWIQADILQRMEEQRQEMGADRFSLGLMVNTSQVNAGSFIYLILTEYPDLRVESLIQQFDSASPYRRLFGHQYVALTRRNENMNPVQGELIAQILDDPPSLFNRAFELEHVYALPDGEEVFLYRQRNLSPVDVSEEYAGALVGALNERAREGDAILMSKSLLSAVVPALTGEMQVSDIPDSEAALAGLARQHRRLFVALGDPVAEEGWARDWLNQNAFWAGHEWLGSLQLLTYGAAPGLPAAAPDRPINGRLGEQIELLGYQVEGSAWKPGDGVLLSLFWQRQEAVDGDYHVFVHLVDGDGQLVAQNDSMPVGGMRPTSRWGDGEIVVDRRGLFLPGELDPGDYELWVGMYRPETGDRLAVEASDGRALGDRVLLGVLTVVEP